MGNYDPWNEIIPGLWQGGSWVEPTKFDFDAVLTSHMDSAPPEEGIKHKEFYFNDTIYYLPTQHELDDAVAWVWQRVMHGERVLVRCHAGLNRSGLIVASTLVMLGSTPDEAILLVRKNRSPNALFNKMFELYVRDLA